MSENLRYYLGFSHFLGIGPVRFHNLLSRFGTVRSAYEADRVAIQETIGKKIGEEFVKFRNSFNPEKKIEEIRKKQIYILTPEDPLFPQQLKDIPDPPICLYVRGDIQSMDFKKEIFFGIVGTRKPTTYGIQVATIFASELAVAGCIIVSGLALGVDAIAHRSAVEQGKKTVAFLGCGVDIIYPQANAKLYQDIINSGGLIMSEFPPGMVVMKGLFVARNRLISGLSRGVMVVEGFIDSGSLITARYAAMQGKEVFAPPAPLTSRNSEAPNLLLKEGAKMVTTTKDVLDELNLKAVPKSHQEIADSLSATEKEIYLQFLSEAKLPDDIVSTSTLPIHEVLSTISTLEIKGIIEKNQEGKYQVTI